MNAWRPVAISYSTTPNENKSVRASSFSPRTCSGDMYATVPSAVPGLVRFTSASIVSPPMATASFAPAGISFARPKSSTFAWPRSVMKIFAGLMSRCTMPLAVRRFERVRHFDSSFEQRIQTQRPTRDAML